MDRRVRGALLVGLALVVGLLLAGTAAAAPPEDPDEDVIGWEDGYWHNESIDVDQSDGLSEAEQEAYVARTMARIEVIQDREFQEPVPVSVIHRSEYSNETAGNTSEEAAAWNNQVWEAMFVVGEDEDVQDVLHSTTTAATTGGYFFVSDEIKIITDTPEEVTIGRGTLAHELVHAQQDQYFNLTNATYQGETQDEQLAVQGLIEGEANYVEDRYEARCGEEWECVDTPESDGNGGSSDVNLGVFVTVFHPYSDGPPYVDWLTERGGWEAVYDAFADPPNSTEQIIHHTDEAPASLAVEDEARGGWEPFPEQGRNGTDTVGEASMFAMMWYQAQLSGVEAETIPPRSITQTEGPHDAYNYESEPTAGWGNDAILPYQRTGEFGPEYGYVWVTRWDSVADAREFKEAYLAILDAHDARQLGPRTYVIDSGRFADAFRLQRVGSRVTIVNAPSVEALDDVRPSIEGASPTPTATPVDDGSDPVPGSPMAPQDTPGEDGGVTSAPPQPGFGAVAALAGFLAWALGRRRRRT